MLDKCAACRVPFLLLKGYSTYWLALNNWTGIEERDINDLRLIIKQTPFANFIYITSAFFALLTIVTSIYLICGLIVFRKQAQLMSILMLLGLPLLSIFYHASFIETEIPFSAWKIPSAEKNMLWMTVLSLFQICPVIVTLLTKWHLSLKKILQLKRVAFQSAAVE